MEDVLGMVGKRLHTQHRCLPFVELDDPAVYLQFFTITLELALFPYTDRIRILSYPPTPTPFRNYAHLRFLTIVKNGPKNVF